MPVSLHRRNFFLCTINLVKVWSLGTLQCKNHLPRQKIAEKVFHFRNVERTCLGCCVSSFKSLVIRIFVLGYHFWHGGNAGHVELQLGTQHVIRYRTRCPAVPIHERMNPVEPPHHVSSQMKWASVFPMFIHILAKIINVLRHVLRRWRLVSAALYLNGDISPPPSFSFNIFNGDAV